MSEAMKCPIIVQTLDGIDVARCLCHLTETNCCPLHGDVSEEVDRFERTGQLTGENIMRERKNMPTFPSVEK